MNGFVSQEGLLKLLLRVKKMQEAKLEIYKIIELIFVRKLKIKLCLDELRIGEKGSAQKCNTIRGMYGELVNLSLQIVQKVANFQDMD